MLQPFMWGDVAHCAFCKGLRATSAQYGNEHQAAQERAPHQIKNVRVEIIAHGTVYLNKHYAWGRNPKCCH